MSTTPVLLGALIGLLSVVIYYVRKHFNYFKDRGIPCDEPHLIYGNLRGIRKTRHFQDLFLDVYKKYKGTGPFCGFYFFQRPTIFVLDKELAKNVFIKDFSNFADRGLFNNEHDDPLSGTLFTVDGSRWRKLRHKLSPTFTSGKMKFMFPTVVEVADRFIDVFSDLVRTDSRKVVEVKDLLARFTTDVIGTCAFGIECNSLHDPSAQFHVMGRTFFQRPRHGNIVNGLIQSFPKLAAKLRMRVVDEDVHQFFTRIVRETVAYREKNNVQRNDFMDMLIKLKNTKPSKGGEPDELGGMSIEEVAAHVFVFFLGGFETSSTAMGYALYELARHQDVQDKLRKHVNEIFARHDNKLTYECMKDMHYLDQVLNETLRLYTIVPHLSRQALNDYVVPGHPKYVIEKGMGIIIPSSSFHLDPEFYPDPERFDPERFAPDKVKERDSVEWLPFGEGPRNCIGLRFGQMQSYVGLSLMIRKFKFSFCEQTPDPLIYDPANILLGTKGGIYLQVERV